MRHYEKKLLFQLQFFGEETDRCSPQSEQAAFIWKKLRPHAEEIRIGEDGQKTRAADN